MSPEKKKLPMFHCISNSSPDQLISSLHVFREGLLLLRRLVAIGGLLKLKMGGKTTDETLEVQPLFFIGWFPKHHYFSRGLTSSKRNHHFLKWWLTSRVYLVYTIMRKHNHIILEPFPGAVFNYYHLFYVFVC